MENYYLRNKTIKYILLLTLYTHLFSQTIHSSISTYYENKTFKNSVQKEDAVVYAIGADIHYQGSKFKAAYQQGETNTKQPPLSDNLETKKIFLRYEYQFQRTFALNVNYIEILKDNIAETDGGKSFAGGMTYTFNRRLSLNFTEFYTDYEYFDIFQADFKVNYKTHFDKVKVKFTSVTKYITTHENEDLRESSKPVFTTNLQERYLTSGIKIHTHYNGYHLGLGAYFGKRAFAIMDDGFKIQHHAMEFDRTYAIGFGRNFYDFVIRAQYIYQRAEELPAQNENVKVNNFRFIANYKF